MAEYDDTQPVGTAPAGGGSWFADHKYAVIGGGAVLLIGAYLLFKNKSASSTASTTGSSVYEIAPGYLTSGGAYGSGIGTDQSIAGGTSGGTTGGVVSGVNSLTPTSTATLDTEQLVGGGYSPPYSGGNFGSSVTTSNGVFNWVQTGAQATADQAAGTQLFYQPSPGSFAPVPAGSVTGPGGWFVNGTPTPLYTESPAATGY